MKCLRKRSENRGKHQLFKEQTNEPDGKSGRVL